MKTQNSVQPPDGFFFVKENFSPGMIEFLPSQCMPPDSHVHVFLGENLCTSIKNKKVDSETSATGLKSRGSLESVTPK